MNPEPFVPSKLSLITLLVGSMLILMGGAAVAPALPQISLAFPEYDGIWITMIITLPSLAIAVTGFAVGMMADRFGKVRTLCVSLAVFAAAGMSGYVIDDLPLLLVSRFFVGVGIAGLTSCITALLSEYYHGTARVKVLSYQSAAMGIGVLVLETGGGALAGYGWHSPFLIYGLGFVILALVIVSLREPKPMEISSARPADGRTGDRSIVLYCYIGIFCTMLFSFTLPTRLPTYMAEVLGEASLMSGIVLGIHGTVQACVTLMHRRIADHVDRFAIIPLGLCLIAISLVMFALPAGLAVTIVNACIMGVGIGLISPTVVNLLAEQVTSDTSGKVMGGYSTLLNLGQFICTFAVAGLLLIEPDVAQTFPVMGLFAFAVTAFFAILYVTRYRGKDSRALRA